MKLLIQRVKEAEVIVNSQQVGSISKGLLVFIGISKECTYEKLEWGAKKLTNLRLWASQEKGFDLNLRDVEGSILVVSQFTLFAELDGNKPNFRKSQDFDKAKEFYEYFLACLENEGISVQTGEFGAMMDVKLVNDGPVTLIVEK
jgi:D-tyrosyl-tRNA(Tyr) deacylase